MARTALINKQQATPKFPSRKYNRCGLCGRTHGYFRKFNICRCCLRDLARQGEIPGLKKASW
ncbi:MAG: type Z 30S ribosomal protein S14 [Planctomycetota bacterium]